MKYITVLDFEIGRVFQYKAPDPNNQQHEYLEDYLSGLGHNLTNCEWMVHDIAGIIKNNDGSYGKL